MNASHPLTIGFSPCPNDTFIFDALVHGKINTGSLRFLPMLEDVESLNQRAFQNELDITKLSFHAFSNLTDSYQLLTSGAALGNGVGPLFISKKRFSDPVKEIKTVAIPGKHTTANFLFSIFYPGISNKKEMLFSDIEQAVLSGEVDAGVIIHENRFTYMDKGLLKIEDLGEAWEKTTGKPIPLGGIAIRRTLPEELKKEVNRLVRRSVEFAFSHPESSMDYIAQHAQEMSPAVRRKHIELYVNDYSVDLGTKGKEAIQTLFKHALETDNLKGHHKDLYVL